MDTSTNGGPLEGLVIADFSRVLAGPYGSMLLADLGATVIKVEPPHGDDTRTWGPPWTEDGTSTYYLSVNRNKHSIALNLADPEDHSRALRLIERADVLMENFRTGSLDRLGLGYDVVSQANPRLVYCSITGFGSAGGAGIPGYDLVVQAVSGLMSLTGPDEDTVTKTGIATADVLTGLHAVIAILSALHARGSTGRGQHVEVNLLSSMLSGLVNFGGAYVMTGDLSHGMGIKHPSIAPYEPFDTADRPLVVAAGNDRLFDLLCTCLDLGQLPSDDRFSSNGRRVENRDELAAILGPIFLGQPADVWFERLSRAGVPCGPINDVGQGIDLAASLGLDPVVDCGGVAQVASPIRLSGSKVSYRKAPPGIGADAEEILRWLDG